MPHKIMLKRPNLHTEVYFHQRGIRHVEIKWKDIFELYITKCSLKSNRVAFTDFSRHWMRSLKIKGCNYILLAAVNLSLKQIILLVSFFFFPQRIACSEKERTSLGLETCKKPKKRVSMLPKRHLRYLPGSFRVGKHL